MFSRLLLLGLAAFWLTMSTLLWRQEFGEHDAVADSVAPRKVLGRILTAPDTSSLDIFRDGKKIGYCRWTATAISARTGSAPVGDDTEPEGMVQNISHYELELEGTVQASPTNNLRFEFHLQLETNQAWREVSLHVGMRPHAWEVSSKAADKTVRLFVNDAAGIWDQTFTYDELRNPEALLQEFGGPAVAGLWSGLAGRFQTVGTSNLTAGISVRAWNDQMAFGHSKVRVYRLEANWLEHWKMHLFVSRVGEVLRLELPGQLVVKNDSFGHL